ncbi:PREDICTED: uncharacterized protein LOC104595707 [Nelumbo nucifera]|uniref:Uncharacterized protein LOC104595707 n=1 Tax=Nelumbo nucifera TaxID=4432 RepID=A0A1U7ZNG7_NELNU|nr:PREDICTED: uncharacterized protein LOC104595707 [Nelumbo nucifera]
MITRSKLVEQLRDYDIRSRQKRNALSIFSPKHQITTRADEIVAAFFAMLFFVLLISSYLTLYFRHFNLGVFIIFLCILLPLSLKVSRHRSSLRTKKERRMLLPLSM